MRDVKLILFDIGGVLIEYAEVFKTASKDQNIPVATFYNTFDKYDREITTGIITPQELYLRCLEDNGLKGDTQYDFLSSWLSDYVPIKPTYELVYKLSSKYAIGLLSNIYKGMVEKMINTKQLPSISYAYKFISANIGMQKPDHEIYDYIMKTTELNPKEILFIDDRDDYLAPAIDKEWNTVKFVRSDPQKTVAELEKILL